MNKNVQVINENLWVVNFNHVKQDWIKGLSFNIPNSSDYACFTQDGKIVLNKNHPIHKDILKILNVIMKLEDELLGNEEGFRTFIKIFVPTSNNLTDEAFEKFINSTNLNSIRSMFNQFSNLELKRRIIKDKHIKGNKKPFDIKKLIRKIIKGKGV